MVAGAPAEWAALAQWWAPSSELRAVSGWLGYPVVATCDMWAVELRRCRQRRHAEPVAIAQRSWYRGTRAAPLAAPLLLLPSAMSTAKSRSGRWCGRSHHCFCAGAGPSPGTWATSEVDREHFPGGEGFLPLPFRVFCSFLFSPPCPGVLVQAAVVRPYAIALRCGLSSERGAT